MSRFADYQDLLRKKGVKNSSKVSGKGNDKCHLLRQGTSKPKINSACICSV